MIDWSSDALKEERAIPLLIILRFLLGLCLFSVGVTTLVRQGMRLCDSSSLCEVFRNDWELAQDAPPIAGSLPSKPLTPPDIPPYVLEYAPYVYLDIMEGYWPCNMEDHLTHITAELNYTPIEEMLQTALNLTNLNRLNHYNKGRYVFLTSKDNPADHPSWLSGEENIPEGSEDADGEEPASETPSKGHSKAPAVLIVVEKGDGIVDAFWFFFYSFNRGNSVFNIRWGNHVGDWEHTLVRFQHGKPKLVYFSEHNFGSAYNYDSVEKIGKRVRFLRTILSLTRPLLSQC